MGKKEVGRCNKQSWQTLTAATPLVFKRLAHIPENVQKFVMFKYLPPRLTLCVEKYQKTHGPQKQKNAYLFIFLFLKSPGDMQII